MPSTELQLILGMSVVTILPRIIPLFMHKVQLPPLVEEWIKGIPYAALAALTMPGVLSVDSGDIWVGIIGLSVAILLALLKLPIYVTVFASVLAVYLYYLLSLTH